MNTLYQAEPSVNTLPAFRLIRSEGAAPDDPAPSQPVQRKPRVSAPFVKLPTSVLKNKDLSAWARLVYPLLLDYKSERGIFPGRDRLADDLGVSIPTVDRALGELCDAGLVEKQRQGRGHTSKYVLLDGSASEHESSPVMTHTDDLSPVTTQTADESSPVTSQEPHESSPVMTPLKEVEQDTLTTPLTPQGESPTVKDKPKRKTRWPDDFTLTDELRAYAESVGIRPGRVDDIFAEFRDKSEAHGYRYVSWPKAWQNWVRSPFQDKDRGPIPVKTSQNGHVPSEVDRLRDRLAFLNGPDWRKDIRYFGSEGPKVREADVARIRADLAALGVGA